MDGAASQRAAVSADWFESGPAIDSVGSAGASTAARSSVAADAAQSSGAADPFGLADANASDAFGAVPMRGRALSAAPLRAALQRYLRVLWPPGPVVDFGAEVVHRVGNVIHLPSESAAASAGDGWAWYRAAAAHAAAHVIYSPPVFDGRGLAPLTRILLGLLEDARVEALACRELPGLRALWRPRHTATLADGDGIEALLLRLARCLIDPDYDDPHPWVSKGKRLFYVEASTQTLALLRPDELRLAASMLGNDLGQMRIRLNAQTYRPGPDYRDDNRWMYAAPQSDLPQPAQAAGLADTVDRAPPAPPDDTAFHTFRYPEWDRLIERLRIDWCEVHESRIESSSVPTGQGAGAGSGAAAETNDDLHGLSRTVVRVLDQERVLRLAAAHPSHRGEQLDIDAVVRSRVARRMRSPVDVRLYRPAVRLPRSGRLLVVIDQSTSSADPWDTSGLSILQGSCRVASVLASALPVCGVGVGICGFNSNGRRAVSVRRVKDFDEPLDDTVLARLALLNSAYSTRLGAMIRHATRAVLAGNPRGDRQVMIVSDGTPYDIDVHDPRYLVSDARCAVAEAGKQGVRVVAVVMREAPVVAGDGATVAATAMSGSAARMSTPALPTPGAQVASQVFGAGGFGVLAGMSGLPKVLRALAL